MADINIGEILESLNNKADCDLRNVDTIAKADAVIDYQVPTASNNYTWYRKYKSGWVEQGAMNLTTTSTAQTLALLVVMADTHYAVQFCKGNDNGNYAYAYPDTTSSVKYKANAGSNQTNTAVVVCGMAA